MKRLFIIHYYPIEYYPPVMNLLNVLGNNIQTTIFTTKNTKSSLCYESKTIGICRPCALRQNKTVLRYIWFLIITLWKMVVQRPSVVMYYEPISGLPVYLYKRYINRQSDVYIHYHEYYTEEDYNKRGARLWKFNHKRECSFLYNKAKWVSQTNRHRLDLFLNENKTVSKSSAHVLPNYPPKSWWRRTKVHRGGIVKCVYIGSLSIRDTFVIEFCRWIKQHEGKVTFDIYSYNFHNDTLAAINDLGCSSIRFFKEGLPYQEIPNVLDKYDVGVLLYKANTVNFQYNETNKFYEYLICGLDVWYPKEMLLLHGMDKSVFAPGIMEIDFDSMVNFRGEIKNDVVDNSSYHWFADYVYNDFIHEMQCFDKFN